MLDLHIDCTFVGVYEENLVSWQIAPKLLQNLKEDAKITITELKNGNVVEFALPHSRRGSVEYVFETGKHYSIRLLCGEQECALSTL